MLPIFGKNILDSAAGRLVSLLAVLRFYASPYVRALAVLDGLVDRIKPNNGDRVVPDDVVTILRQEFESLRGHTTGISLDSATHQIDRILRHLKSSTTYSVLAPLFGELRLRMHDGLTSEVFFHLTHTEAALYTEMLPFGAEVAAKFPEATLDIEEATKCLALGRWTACVFHLMRAMEHGLKALASHLGFSVDFKTWDGIIRSMRKEVDNYTASSFKGNLDFLRQALERLTAVQVALRNEVMHARSFYDEERAGDIYRAVRAFMQQLATRLKAEQ